jgi:opacity protein-like surface antigen
MLKKINSVHRYLIFCSMMSLFLNRTNSQETSIIKFSNYTSKTYVNLNIANINENFDYKLRKCKSYSELRIDNDIPNNVKERNIPLYSPPGMIISPIAGFLVPLTQLKGNISSYSLTNKAVSSSSYFEKWGFDAGSLVKLPFGKRGNLRLVVSLTYSKFYEKGNDSSGAYTIKPKLNDLQIGIGGEWAFTQFKEIIPFVGFDLTGNIFDGSIEHIDNTTSVSVVTNYNTTTRYGFAIGVGADYYLSKDVSILIGVKYNIANLLGRKYGSTGAHELNDASFSINGVTINAKTISFLNIYGGISINIGESKSYH